MAVTQTVTCDRCGEGITSDRSLLRAESGPLRDRRESIDLCSACAAALLTWLAAGATPPPFALDPKGA